MNAPALSQPGFTWHWTELLSGIMSALKERLFGKLYLEIQEFNGK